jgi:hypothetical protein
MKPAVCPCVNYPFALPKTLKI